jgi:DNA invertase Pin-like site-specific DNA recombinase
MRKRESDSIGTQMSLLRQFASEQPDMELISEYEDTDRTGTNFNRPGFNRMLDDIRNGKINCIIVKDLSRFGRNHIETGNYIERVFPFMGVRFISISDDYDSLTAKSEDGIIVPLKNLINEVYAKDISKKVCSQYEMKRKRGDFCGSFAPYGYVKNGNALVIDKTASEVVKRIFNLVIEGYSDLAIARILNDEGVPKHRSKRWYKSAIKRITENTAYLGRLEQGKYKTDLMNGSVRVNKSPELWVVVNDTHPPIIEHDTFEAVRKIRQNRKQAYNDTVIKANRPASSKNILKGIMYCADCRRPMLRHKVVRADGSVDYCFLCATYEETGKDCTKKSFWESELLPMLHSLIYTQMQILTDVQRIIESIRKQANYVKKFDVTEEKASKAKNRLSRLMGLKSSLYESFKVGTLSKDEYLQKKTNCEAEYNELLAELERFKAQKTQTEVNTGQNKWAAAFESFSKEKELSRELVISLIERIEVDFNCNVDITLKYRDEYEALIKMYKMEVPV